MFRSCHNQCRHSRCTVSENRSRRAGRQSWCAFGALANDVTSIYWNPSGNKPARKTSFSDTHTVWLADIRYNYLAFATPIKNIGTLGASITFLNVPDTEITTLAKPGGTGLWYSAWDTAVSLAYARQLYEQESGVKLSVGINAKYIHQQIHRESAKGVAIDVGTLYHTGWRSLRIGMWFLELWTGDALQRY